MKCAQPPGARSTMKADCTPGPGGEWVMCRQSSGQTPIYAEMEAIFRTMPETVSELAREELLVKMRKAASGRLIYGDALPADVCVMAIREDVLEIRIGTYPGEHDTANGEPILQQVRFYFSEPAHYTGQLWGASIRSKYPANSDWRHHQNEHAVEAYERLNTFDMYLRTVNL